MDPHATTDVPAASTVQVETLALEGPPPNIPTPGFGPNIPGHTVGDLVGRGGCGKVYRATHLGLDRTVAVKLISGDPTERDLARFREEARAVARLSHPNVAQVFDSGTADGQPFFSQEFLPGGTLAQKLREHPLATSAAAELVETLAQAVDHCHAQGVIHRDLKPQNVLYAADGTAKITDFGLAKLVDADDSVTRAGEILGTPAYMPPEQASGAAASVGPAADIYALGAILYECLTGRPPFVGPDLYQTLLMVQSMEPVPPRTLQPGVPRDLETICLKCLQKSVDRRYRTAAELADDLRRFLDGEPIRARPIGPVERALKWARRRKVAAALLGLSATLAVAVAVATVVVWNQRLELAERNRELEANAKKLETARDFAQQQLDDATFAYNRSTSLFDKFLYDVAHHTKDLPGSDRFQTAVLKSTADALREFDARWPSYAPQWGSLALWYDRYGNLLLATGRFDDAEAAYKRAIDYNVRLAAEHPDATIYPTNQVLVLLKLANVESGRGKSDEAAKLRAEAAKLLAGLPETALETVPGLEVRYMLGMAQANDALAKGDLEAAAKALQASADVAQKLADFEGEPARKIEAISAKTLLGGLLATLNRIPEATTLLEAGQRDLAKVAEDSVAARKARASLAGQLGMLYDKLGRPDDVEKQYQASAKEYDSLAADFPNRPAYRVQAALAWQGLALLKLAPKDLPEAKVRYQKAKKYVDGLLVDFPDHPQFQEMQATYDKSLRVIDEHLKKK